MEFLEGRGRRGAEVRQAPAARRPAEPLPHRGADPRGRRRVRPPAADRAEALGREREAVRRGDAGQRAAEEASGLMSRMRVIEFEPVDLEGEGSKMILLSADWHLDDQPQNEYRWLVFDQVRSVVSSYQIDAVFVLGDMVDRRDRFSAAFVNRLLFELRDLAKHTQIFILRGNHDTTLKLPNYFEFITEKNIYYISQPTNYGKKALLLPFTPNPREDWKELGLRKFNALFMP